LVEDFHQVYNIPAEEEIISSEFFSASAAVI
jgi:hypothetical protein